MVVYSDFNSIRGLCIIQMIKTEDIIFWILILAIIGIAIWMLYGSPSESNALISIGLFVAASEILVWGKIFVMDKHTAVGFVKVRNELNNLKNEFSVIQNDIKIGFNDVKNEIVLLNSSGRRK